MYFSKLNICSVAVSSRVQVVTIVEVRGSVVWVVSRLTELTPKDTGNRIKL